MCRVAAIETLFLSIELKASGRKVDAIEQFIYNGIEFASASIALLPGYNHSISYAERPFDERWKINANYWRLNKKKNRKKNMRR